MNEKDIAKLLRGFLTLMTNGAYETHTSPEIIANRIAKQHEANEAKTSTESMEDCEHVFHPFENCGLEYDECIKCGYIV